MQIIGARIFPNRKTILNICIADIFWAMSGSMTKLDYLWNVFMHLNFLYF